jgi:DNA-binding transcriptional LysR family regulator
MAMLPSAKLQLPIYRGSLKALPIELPETRRPIGLVTLKKRDLSPVALLFVNCAREVIRRLAMER